MNQVESREKLKNNTCIRHIYKQKPDRLYNGSRNKSINGTEQQFEKQKPRIPAATIESELNNEPKQKRDADPIF